MDDHGYKVYKIPQFKMRKPCAECPFRKVSSPTSLILSEYAIEYLYEKPFHTCHMTGTDFGPINFRKPMEACVGFLIARHNMNNPSDFMVDAIKRGDYSPSDLQGAGEVMETAEECIETWAEREGIKKHGE